jgi:spore germination protein KA
MSKEIYKEIIQQEDYSAEYVLTTSLKDNIKLFQSNIFNNDDSIIYRYITNKSSGMKFCLIFIDGMSRSGVINGNIIDPLIRDNIEVNENISNYIMEKVLRTDENQETQDINLAITKVLYGDTLLLIENLDKIIYINTKGWSKRSVKESEGEAVVRGPKEAFTESININTTLIRRKITSPKLKFHYNELGSVTKTKICFCYIEGIVSQEILDDLKSRIDKIEIDGVLESSYIEESIKDHPYSIFETVGTTERPDTVAGKLLEGRIAILCDGTPFVMTIPFLFEEYFQVNEDYYSNFVYGTLNRMLRMLAFLFATSVPALYVALTTFHQELIPTPLILGVAAAEKGVPFPTVVEALLMMIAFELLREAGTRMPKNIGQAISIVGALVLGDAAVNANFVSAPMVIVVAITAISGFALPKMVTSILVIKFTILFASAFLGLYGYIFEVIGISLYLFSMKSFGVDYMYSYGRIGIKDLKDVYFRAPWESLKKKKFIIGSKNQ